MRTGLFVILLAALNALVHSVLFPPWMGEDEPWHLEYAMHVADGALPSIGSGARITREDLEHHPLTQIQVKRRFPDLTYERIEETQHAILASMAEQDFWRRVDWLDANSGAQNFDQVAPGFTATSQPPLYYLLTGLWLRASGASSVLTKLYVARALSFVLYLVTVALAWRLFMRVFDDPSTRLAAGLLVALWPGFAREAAMVNNDVLACALGAALLLWAATAIGRPHKDTRRSFGVAPGLAVAAVLTKMTTAGAAGLALTVSAGRFLRGRRATRVGLALLGVAVLAVAALAYWNVQHNPALPRSLDALLERLQRGLSAQNRATLAEKIVGRFNWNTRGLPPVVETAIGVGALGALLGAVTVSVRRPPNVRVACWWLCVVAVLVQVGLIALRGVSEARYLMPVAPALAVVLAGGLVTVWRPERRRRATVWLALLLLAYGGVYVWRGMALHHYLAWNA